MIIRFLIFVILISSFISCSNKDCIAYNKSSYQIDGANLGCIGKPNFFLDIDTVDFGNFIDARLYSTDNDIRFVKAYIDSNLISPFLIDTVNKAIV